jgi:uncharacterized linocin/CFP29 family protein
MNNLHRELAPISDDAWADLEAEARRTFSRHVAARRVVDVIGPSGLTLSAVGTGHLQTLDAPATGVQARRRGAQPIVEFRVPFVVDRQSVDDVARGAKDADWQPVKDAARQIAFAEDRAIFDGFTAAGIGGIRAGSSNPAVALPAEVRDYPNAVAQALTSLRLAGVDGPYSLLLSADAYTAVAETTDHGYPIREHIARVIGSAGDIIWAPAISGAFLLTTRGGDYELYLGQDLSIGYLSHDATSIELYFQESLTFFVQTSEAGVALTAA